jgi:hypothetical protein
MALSNLRRWALNSIGRLLTKDFSNPRFQVERIGVASQLIEKNLPSPAERYYPVRIGELLESRYQIVGKLGFGITSTARDLTGRRHVSLKTSSSLGPCRELSTHQRMQQDPIQLQPLQHQDFHSLPAGFEYQNKASIASNSIAFGTAVDARDLRRCVVCGLGSQGDKLHQGIKRTHVIKHAEEKLVSKG